MMMMTCAQFKHETANVRDARKIFLLKNQVVIIRELHRVIIESDQVI